MGKLLLKGTTLWAFRAGGASALDRGFREDWRQELLISLCPHPRLGTAPRRHICLQKRLCGCQHCRPGTSSQARLPSLLEGGAGLGGQSQAKPGKPGTDSPSILFFFFFFLKAIPGFILQAHSASIPSPYSSPIPGPAHPRAPAFSSMIWSFWQSSMKPESRLANSTTY